MLGSFQLHQAYHQAIVIDHIEMRTSNGIQNIRSYRFEVSILVPEFVDLGFVAENPNFQNLESFRSDWMNR